MLRLTSSFLLLAVAGSLFAQTAESKKKDAAPGAGSRAAMAALNVATDPSAIQVAPGFKVELIYTVPKGDQGSWVALTMDPKGRIIAGDQYGGLFRITLPPIGTTTGTKIEPLAVDFTNVRVPGATAE